jgi:GT2 family glycosyltransferase/glycosyltransferase involved in cell wall biosynthesis
MSLQPTHDLALEAFTALEMDQLERVVELASRIEGPMRANGIRDFLLGSVLARRGEHEQALEIALALYGQDASRASGERLRADTLARMQGLSRSGAATTLLDETPQAAPVAIDPLEPLSHAMPSSELGSEANWQALFAFWSDCIGLGRACELGRLGQAQLERLVGAQGEQALGLQAAQASMGYDEASAFTFVYYLLALRGVEALPAPAGLVGPHDDQPVRVSLILPAYNKWILTLNCLRSLAVAEHGASGFEVILADDASTDETPQIAARNPWLRHVRLERNSGFVDNCNHAAAQARGEVLLFLNNDTLVGNGWLGALLATLRRRPGAGVVGSQVYGSDGGLLESGGILWGNGDVWNHGRGFGPERWFELDHEREVDYVSGCAMAIRRELWQQLGGFDTLYRPAYCEDADFCLRAREAGQTVLVQPQSRILHLEGLSNARSTDAGLKRYQLTNLEQLRRRWSRELLTEQPIDMSQQLLASDRGLRRGPVALVVDHYFPTPDRDAGSRCTQALVSSLLALGFKVIFLPENFAPMESYRRRLEGWGVLCLHGHQLSQCWPEWLGKQIERLDLILYNRPHITARFLPTLSRLFPEAHRLYNTHDLHGWREALEAQQPAELPEQLAPPPTPAAQLEALCTPQEQAILRQMHGVISISAKETALLRRHFPRGVHTVPGYVCRWRGAGASRADATRAVLFVGGFGHRPNRAGLEWFVERVWPLLAAEVQAGLRLIVVGSNCPSELEQQLRSIAGIHFEGAVSEARLAELYGITRLSLAPLPYGAGLKGKVVEALSWGHRVVGSAYAFEGLEEAPWAAPALAMRCCRAPAEFAAALREGLAIPSAEAAELEQACQAFIERCFSAKAQQQALRELLPAQLLAQAQARQTQRLPWPEAAPGPTDLAVTLLASSRGLCHDGWLEVHNQLVLQLEEGASELRLGIYLPETGEVEGESAVELELGDGSDTVLRGRMVLQRGLNRGALALPEEMGTLATLVVRSFYRYLPEGQGDQRQLIAVLSELHASKAC